ncbi:hypothetical protein [Mesorhizobium sp. ORS 3428]|uniref:hypothetical protein n=1 Tax=Mesorhizobium sp. ORS 3428 TaxID=540997 RepID=UPI0008D910C8|nr:hypothetical protein [Mesorhizobium sp. ORS 3428]OHV86654.1 hypothetical protein ORS3428_22765 [Mesorhizobium sp. ORS 3428]
MNEIEDEEPWADPAIRTDYEAALGRFILAFNEVDYYLSQIIAWELGERNAVHLRATPTTGPFAARLDTLEALSTTSRVGDIAALPMARLRSLNADRYRLAHGHFEQNPFDGSYGLLLAAKAHEYPIARVSALADELALIAEKFRHAYLAHHFEDLGEEE